ncbi:MAG: hypothetical protein WA705_19525 [Candidatus Ozemobacteraceae bacterium]
MRGFWNSRKGVALLVIVGVILTLAIGLTVAIPRAKNSVREAKEDELRFYLGEFSRAVERFHDRNGREPVTFDELLQDAQGRRYLRRIYTDPFSGRPDWAFETIGTGGVRIHSTSSQPSLAGVPISEFR